MARRYDMRNGFSEEKKMFQGGEHGLPCQMNCYIKMKTKS